MASANTRESSEALVGENTRLSEWDRKNGRIVLYQLAG